MAAIEERCKRPGCTGKIVDGFCEDCGRPPVGQTAMSAISASQVASARSQTGAGGASRSAATSGSSSSSSSLSGRTGTGRSGRSSGRSHVSSRRQLGAGLVSLPELPSMDPLLSLMKDAVVPERKRFCNNCGAKLNHEKGFCPMCGHEYSFLPTLKPGDVVAGQYEVKGAMAYGGLGWIYLSWDKTLSRWVVLKGLLNSKDEASAAVAVAERQFLAAVKHPKIVGIYNFVTRGNEGFIVMEYVGGKTLKTIRQERGPLPVEEAIAYMHGILPAFAYLERQGMVYCDFKPDNIMLEEDDVKLIDMGGVRRVDDDQGDVYGTKGYSAPEGGEHPSFSSDLYTVARCLAVLMMDFKFQGQYEFTLPTPQEQPLFAQFDSLYRFLLRATHQEPDMRFQSADEMSEQLIGVLREVMAIKTNLSKPAESTVFFGDALMNAEGDLDNVPPANPRLLPPLKLDATDPAASMLMSVSTATGEAKLGVLQRAAKQFPESSETGLRLAEYLIGEGKYAEGEKALAAVEAQDVFDWRVHWYRGRSLLLQNKPLDAYAEFDKVYSELPGEQSPKLAMALASEMAGRLNTAIQYYDLVSRVDPGYTSAAFGLARCLAANADRSGAVAAFTRVPVTSSLYAQAQMSLARTLLLHKPAAPGENELVAASKAIQSLNIEGFALHRLSAELLMTAVTQVEAKAIVNASGQVLGQTFEAVSLRAGAERELRACARYAKTPDEKIAFIDQANQVRPRTLV